MQGLLSLARTRALPLVLHVMSYARPNVEKITTPPSTGVGDEVPDDACDSMVSLRGVREWHHRVVDGGDHTREEHSASATKRIGRQAERGGEREV